MALMGTMARVVLTLSLLLIATISLVSYLSPSADATTLWSRLTSRDLLAQSDANNLPVNEILAPKAASVGMDQIIANGRTIGYYQASNTKDRLCNRVSPSQINTDGLTHLYYAFAKIDPISFATVPANDGDTDRYPEFTKLQSSKLKTWLAIGGFDFSDPGPTRDTWYVTFSPRMKNTTSKLMQQE
ncbi:MAG: hypothetical protein Q9195_004253 [Heterodermia aff. obscurata]